MSYPSLAGGGGADTCVRKMRNMHVHDAYLTPHLCAAFVDRSRDAVVSVRGRWTVDRKPLTVLSVAGHARQMSSNTYDAQPACARVQMLALDTST